MYRLRLTLMTGTMQFDSFDVNLSMLDYKLSMLDYKLSMLNYKLSMLDYSFLLFYFNSYSVCRDISTAEMLKSLKSYTRKTIPVYCKFNIERSKCQWHSKIINRVCKIKTCKAVSDNIIYGRNQNCFASNTPWFKCRREFNALECLKTMKFASTDYIRVYHAYTNQEIGIVSAGSKLFTLELYFAFNSKALADPCIGPHQMRDIVYDDHKNKIISELAVLSQYKYDEDELKEYVNAQVPSKHFFCLLFYDLYINHWLPAQKRMIKLVHRGGGEVIAADWTIKVLNKLHTSFDAFDYEDESKEVICEEDEAKTEDYWLKNDKRRLQLKCKVATLVIQNHSHFCASLNLTPRESEAHCYLIPRLAETYYQILINSKRRIRKMVFKLDGLVSDINIPFKVISFMQYKYGNIVDGAAGSYNLYDMLAVTKVASDGLHRVGRLNKSGAITKKNAERFIIVRDRSNIATMADQEPLYVDLNNYFDIMTFIEENKEVYFNSVNLSKLINYTQCIFILKRTKDEQLIAKYEKKLKRHSSDYIYAQKQISKALLQICPSQLVYYTPILYGIITPENHFKHNLIVGKMHGVRNGITVALDTPFLGAPISTIIILAKTLKLNFDCKNLIKCGYHSYPHLHGILSGFYKFIFVNVSKFVNV